MEGGGKREITVAIFINCMLEKRLVIASPSRKRVTMLTPTKQNFEFVIERYRMKRSTSTLSTKQKQKHTQQQQKHQRIKNRFKHITFCERSERMNKCEHVGNL